MQRTIMKVLYLRKTNIMINKKEKKMNRTAANYIREVAYYPINEMLEVQFTGDDYIYQYFDVPEEVWYDFKNTASLDIYFNSRITARYRYRRTKRDKKK